MSKNAEVPGVPATESGHTAATPAASTNAPRAFREDQRVPALDGVRGLAILMVFLFHMRPSNGKSAITDAWNSLLSPLWCGVDLFFVLSGFLITGILLSTRDHKHYFRNFYARRTLRIFPLYFGVLIGLFVLIPLAGKLPIPQLQKLISGEYYQQLWNHQVWLWLYIQNFLQAKGSHQLPGLGHFWSLAIEEQFYLVWPFLVYALSERRMIAMSVAIVLMGIPLRWFLFTQGFDAWAIRHLTYARIDSLAAGACVVLAVRNLSRDTNRKLVVGLIAGSVVGLSVLTWKVPGVSTNTFEVTVWGYTLFSLFFSGVILAVAQELIPGGLLKLLTSRTLIFFGTLSYGIYVFHWPIIHGVHALVGRLPKSFVTGMPLASHVLECVLSLGISLGVSILSWRLYESKVLGWKKYFRYS